MKKTDPPIQVEQPRKGMIADAARKRTFGQVTDRKLGTKLAKPQNESFLRVNDRGELKPWRVMNRKMRQAGRGVTDKLNTLLSAQVGQASEQDTALARKIMLPKRVMKQARRVMISNLTPQDQEKILRQPPPPEPPSDQLRAERSKSRVIRADSPEGKAYLAKQSAQGAVKEQIMGKNAPMKGSAAVQPLKQYKQQGGTPMPKKPANQPGASMVKPPKLQLPQDKGFYAKPKVSGKQMDPGFYGKKSKTPIEKALKSK